MKSNHVLAALFFTSSILVNTLPCAQGAPTEDPSAAQDSASSKTFRMRQITDYLHTPPANQAAFLKQLLRSLFQIYRIVGPHFQHEAPSAAEDGLSVAWTRPKSTSRSLKAPASAEEQQAAKDERTAKAKADLKKLKDHLANPPADTAILFAPLINLLPLFHQAFTEILPLPAGAQIQIILDTPESITLLNALLNNIHFVLTGEGEMIAALPGITFQLQEPEMMEAQGAADVEGETHGHVPTFTVMGMLALPQVPAINLAQDLAGDTEELSLPSDEEIWERLSEEGNQPEQPIAIPSGIGAHAAHIWGPPTAQAMNIWGGPNTIFPGALFHPIVAVNETEVHHGANTTVAFPLLPAQGGVANIQGPIQPPIQLVQEEGENSTATPLQPGGMMFPPSLFSPTNPFSQ